MHEPPGAHADRFVNACLHMREAPPERAAIPTHAFQQRAWFLAAVDDEQHFVSHILAFFAASDGIVVENLGARFMSGA